MILAVFMMTIGYSFTALITVGSAGRPDFAPTFTVLFSLALLTASLIGFVALLQITGSRVRVDRVLTDLGRVAVDRLEDRFPTGEGWRHAIIHRPPPPEPEITRHLSYTGPRGQLVAVDNRHLRRLARRRSGYVRVTVRVGDGMLPGDVIAVGAEDSTLTDTELSRCLVVAVERSLQHDPLYALRLLVDIAIRALSAAVNDPTTAVRSLDEIEGVLRAAAALPLGPVGFQLGNTTLVLDPPGWDDFLSLALLEIIEYGAAEPQVSRRLTAMLDDLQLVVEPIRRPALDRFRALLEEINGRAHRGEQLVLASMPDRQGIGGSHAVL